MFQSTIDLCDFGKMRRINPIINAFIDFYEKGSKKKFTCPHKKVKQCQSKPFFIIHSPYFNC